MKESTVKKLWSVKWNLVIMAAFCFAYAVYIYVTPAAGGEGTFMITPTAGLPGLLKQLPWIFIGLGVLVLSPALRPPRAGCSRGPSR